jgi:hypothetical protein
VQAADTCLRVTPFRGEPDVDGLGDRLLLCAGEAREAPEGFGPGAAGGRVGDAAVALLADEPLAAARGPLGFRVPAPLGEGRHRGDSYHTRTYDGQTGAEMTDEQWDLGMRDEPAVPGQLDIYGVLAGSGGQTRTDTDPWRVAYWDDVLWWVTDRLDRIDPQLWRVAP